MRITSRLPSCHLPRCRAALAMLAVLVRGVVRAASVGYGELEETWRGEVQQLSWSPRAFLVNKFLSDEECEHIIKIASPQMVESRVLGNQLGKSKKSHVRTSTGTFFGRGHDNIIKRIEKRVAEVTMIPVEHQEGFQVLRYVNGQKYDAHHDFFYDQENTKVENGGQRVITMLMYLSTPVEGGETVFPDAERKVSGPGWSDCALKGLANKPVKGDALMFYSLTPGGSRDPSSVHASCPTLKGYKWSATLWIHVAPFGGWAKHSDPKGCHDDHTNCHEWSHSGECEKNPPYMLTSCRAACKVCDPAQTNTGRNIDVPINTH